jgi:hypothetical protein
MMRRRKKGLSAEDRELWDRVKRSTSPLARSGPKAGAEDPIEAPPAVSKRRKGDPVAPESIRPFQIGDAVSAPSAPLSSPRFFSTKAASTGDPSPARSGAVKLSSSNTRSITV